jgi:hypothetical protein
MAGRLLVQRAVRFNYRSFRPRSLISAAVATQVERRSELFGARTIDRSRKITTGQFPGAVFAPYGTKIQSQNVACVAQLMI